MPSLEQIANGAKASGLTQKDFEARILANPRYSGITREEIATAWNSGLKKKDQSSGLNGPGTKTGSTASRSLSGIREQSTQPTSVSDAAPSLSRQQGLSDLSKQKSASASKAEGLYGIKRNEVYQNAALQVIQENIDNGYITADEVASLSQTPDKIFESIAERKTEESQKLRNDFKPKIGGKEIDLFPNQLKGGQRSPEQETIDAYRQSFLKRSGATLKIEQENELNSRLQDLTKQEIIGRLPENKRNDKEFLKEIEKDLFLTQGIGLDLSGDKRFNDQNVLKDIAVSFGAGIQSIDYGIRSVVGSGTDMFGLPLEAGNILAKQGIKYNSTQFEKDVLDSLNDGDFENAARITLNVTANSLPIMAVGAAAFSTGSGLGAAFALSRGATGAAVTAAANTAGTVASYATLATLSAAQTYGDVKDEEWFKEMSDIEALGYVSAMGGTEAFGEMVGGKMLTRAMRGIVAAGGEKAAKKTFTEYIKGIGKAGGVNLYENTLGEAFTGASQYVVDNFAKGEEITANGIIDAAKRSGVSGLGMAGTITTAGASVSVPLYLGSKIGREFKVLKLNKEIEKKRNAILKAETPDERYALAKDVLALTKERDGAVKSSVDFFDKMSKDDQAKVYALTTELQETAKVRLESKDEEARDSMQKQIFSAYSQVKEIIKKYDNVSQEGVDEIMSLPDDQVISFNVESLDQVPEQFRDRAKKKNDFEFKVRETIFGLPFGKETTKVVNQGYSYTLTGKEAKDYASQNKTVDTKYDSQEGQQVPSTEQTGEAPVEAQPVEEAVTEEVDTKEEDSEIEFYDSKIIDLQSEIEIEKGNLKEAKAEIDQQIKDVRADKTLTPAERREKVEDLQAQKQDTVDDLTGNIEVYKEEIKAFKSDIKKVERAKAKKLEKAKAVPVAAPTIAEPVVVDKATDKEGRKPQETQKDGNDLILKHGSPYSFDKFLLEKVGTGEGAQAFGYGLYFTESTGIAESYARKLSEDKTGMLYTIRVKDGNTKNWLPWREPVTDGYFDKLKLTEQEQNEYQEYLDADRDDYKEYFGAYGDLNNGDGYFFQGSVEAENVPNYAVYLDLADAFGQEKATDILKRSGYSGIVYNSKKGYGDAKNYVVFDPASIEIIESGKPAPKTAKAQEAATVKETKAPAGKVANSEEVASRIASSPSKSRMYTAVKRAISSLKKLSPDAEYVFVDSDAEAAEYYKQNMKRVPADEKGTDKGRIIQNKNNGNIEIVINTSRADATTVYHELFHAAFYKAYAQDAATAIDFANRLSKVLNSGTAAEKTIAKRIDQHVANYKGDSAGVISEEFLSELAGILAADSKSITQGMAAKIANFINNIAKKMGIGPVFTEAATTKEVVDFMNSFAAAAREGGDVLAFLDGPVESFLTTGRNDAVDIEVRPSKQKSTQTLEEARKSLQEKARKVFPSSTDEALTEKEISVFFMNNDFSWVNHFFGGNYEKVAQMFSDISKQDGVYLFPSVTIPEGFIVIDTSKGDAQIEMNIKMSPRKGDTVYIDAIELFDKGLKGTGAGTRLMNRIISSADKLGFTIKLDAFPTRKFQYDQEKGKYIPDKMLEKMADRLVTDFYSKFGFVSQSSSPKDKAKFRSMYREPGAKSSELRPSSSKSVQQKANTVDGIREKVGKLPTIMTEAMAFADAASMNNKIEFKRALQEKFKKNLPELRKKYNITDGSVMDDNLKKYLVDAYIYETLVAIDSYPDALGWYDSKTRKAMEIMSLIHPELKTDPISESAFKIVLAITSNGNKVKQNFDEADRQYRYWKDNGRFDSETSIGTQSAGIKSTLRLVNAVLDRISMPEFYSFLNSKFKAGDLTYLNSSGKKTNLLSGYLTKDIVFGASVFGPKIGNGFFMNLNGEFGQLTMDRWFMRQYGRLTGTLLSDEITAKKKISNNILRVKESLKNLTRGEKALLNSLIPGALQKDAKSLAIAVAKISVKIDTRNKISVGNLNELRKAANTLDKNLSGEIEAPQGGKQRKFIVDIFNEVQEKLKNEFGIDITIADLQAVNWYPEKSLYKAFKKGKDSVKSKDLTSIDEQPDYESAAVSLAKENGITQSEINDATGRITGDGTTGESIGESVKQGIDKFGGFDQAVIEDLSKKILDVKSEMTGGFDEQTEVPKKTPRGKKSKTNALIEATPSEDGRLPVDIAVQELDDFSPRSSKLDNSKKGFSSDELMYLKESGLSQDFIKKLINNGTYAFLTAENPDNVQTSKEENEKYMAEAKEWLIGKGYDVSSIYGMYNNKENSFFVPYMTFEDAVLFREKFNQESVAHSDALINGKSQDRVAKETFKKDYESLKKKEKAEVDAGVAESKYCNPRIKGENSFDVDYKDPNNDYYSVLKPYYSMPMGVSTSYDDKKKSRFSISEGLKNFKSREEVIVDILENGGKYGLNDDGKGNFVFYHYGNIEGPAIKGSFFGKNKYTSDKRYYKPVSMYYTRRGESESMVQTFGRKPHVVLVPKNKVYPFNVDPMGYYYEAKRRYVLHLYPSGEAYGDTVENDLDKFNFPVDAQAAFIGEVAKENGYLMMVSTWNSMGLSTRAESQTDLEYDVEATNTYRETNERRIYPDKELIDIQADLQSRSSRSSEASDVAREVADQYYKNRGNVDPSLMQRLTGVIYRWFIYTPDQMEILRMKETRESMIGRKMDKSEKLAGNLYELIKKNVEAAALVEEYMSGPTAENIDAIEKLKNGAKILDAANEMRAFIDHMSSQLVRGPAFATLNQELKEAVLRNIGSYLKTSYRFWKDKNFKITDKAIKNAAAHVYDVIRAKKMGLLVKEGKSQLEVEQFLETTKEQMFNEALQQINDYVREIEKIRSAPKYKGSGMVTTGQVKIPGESFQKRKDIPSFIQELLGVEKDPHIRFLDTAEALINILYKGEMAAKLVNAFGNDVLISDDVITKEDKESGMYKQVKDEYSPLNRMWVPIDFFDVINNTNIYSSDNEFIQGYFNILRISRMSKVILTPSAWRKNLTGGWQALMANGIINPEFVKDLASRPAFTVMGKETEDIEQLLDEMAQYGIGGGGVDAQLIKGVEAMYSGIIRGDYKYADKAWNYIKNVGKKLSKRYGAIDDYTKMVAYRDRRISFAKKLYGANYETLSEYQQESVRAAAAEEVKQTFPTFSRLPPFFRGVAKLPFGDFLSFPLEAMRSLLAVGNTARADIKKSMDTKLSAVQRAEYAKTGVAKILGTVTALSIAYVIPRMIESALGFDDEDEAEDIKLLRPDWMFGDNLVVVNADKNGNVNVYNTTTEDSYGGISSMAVHLFRGEFSEVAVALADAVGFNMTFNMFVNLSRNEDQYGRPLFESYDSFAKKSLNVIGYITKETVASPWLYSSGRDAIDLAEKKGSNVFGEFGELAAERAIIRDYQYNVGQQFYFKAVKGAVGIKKEEQYTTLTGGDRERRLLAISKLKREYEALLRYSARYNNYDMVKSAKSAIKKYYGKDEERYILYGQMN